MFDASIVRGENYEVTTAAQKILQDYESFQNITNILGIDEWSEEDKLTVSCARKIQCFMSQPLPISQVFVGYEGRLVSIKDTICSLKEIPFYALVIPYLNPLTTWPVLSRMSSARMSSL